MDNLAAAHPSVAERAELICGDAAGDDAAERCKNATVVWIANLLFGDELQAQVMRRYDVPQSPPPPPSPPPRQHQYQHHCQRCDHRVDHRFDHRRRRHHHHLVPSPPLLLQLAERMAALPSLRMLASLKPLAGGVAGFEQQELPSLAETVSGMRSRWGGKRGRRRHRTTSPHHCPYPPLLHHPVVDGCAERTDGPSAYAGLPVRRLSEGALISC